MKLEVKVCGMIRREQIETLAGADYIGLIFAGKSPRRVTEPAENYRNITIPKVGVFVNSTLEDILEKANTYNLSVIQLHGDESPEFCQHLTDSGYRVWKALSVSDSVDLLRANDYDGGVERVVLDTRTPARGGSGQKFDWTILDSYHSTVPFMLAGGITPDDADSIKSIKNQRLMGVDINSRFEVGPGVKDINLVLNFIQSIKS